MKLKNSVGSKLMLFFAFTLMLVLTATSFANGEVPDQAPPPQNQIIESEMGKGVQMISTQRHIFRSGPDGSQTSVPAPANLGRAPQTSRILVQFNPDSCGANTTPWPEDARESFQFATDIWSTIVKSKVTITVDACWAPLPTGVLGAAGAVSFWRDFPGAPQSSTWYPSAVANALAEADLDVVNGLENRSDIVAIFNSQGVEWYFGTDGKPGSDQFDFSSVILHEISHGMGFAGSMRILNDGRGYWGGNVPDPSLALPFSYDRLTRNGGTFLVSGLPNYSTQLGLALTSENIRFAGPEATTGNSNNNPKLFAPSDWIQGTSYSHLDLEFASTEDALMIGFLSRGTSIHDLGPVSRGLINDIGWAGASPGIPLAELNQDLYLPFVVR